MDDVFGGYNNDDVIKYAHMTKSHITPSLLQAKQEEH